MAGRQVAGRYVLAEPLGAGGMGVVWRATDELVGREVAVTRVQTHGVGQERLIREARAAARLHHPGAVTVYDVVFDSDAGEVFIVTELVAAPTLADLVERGGPLPTGRVARIGLGLLEVLDEAHRIGIVHRDVKPANVLVLPDDRVKLADFGSASILGESALTLSAVLGSPAYMAPEQVSGQRGDSTTDVWGLGATLYYAVEGVAAFGRETIAGCVNAVLNEPLPTPRRAGVDLADLLRALLEKDPARRPVIDHIRQTLLRIAPPAASATPAARPPAKDTAIDRPEPRASSDEAPLLLSDRRPSFGRAGGILPMVVVAGVIVFIAAGFALAAGGRSPRSAIGVASVGLVTIGLMMLQVRAANWRREVRLRRVPAETAVRRSRYARWLIERGRAAEAESILREFLRSRSRDDPQAIVAHTNLAAALRILGRPAEAEQILDQALGDARRSGFTDPECGLRLRANLAAIRHDLGDVGQATELLRDALDRAEAKLGAEHPDVVSARGDLAVALRSLGRLDEAEAASRTALASASRRPASELREISRLKGNLAAIRRDLGALDEAEELLRSALEDARDALGPAHPQTFTIRVGLATVLHDLGRHDEAIRLLAQVITDRSQKLGQRHPATLEARNTLAFARLSAGEADTAARDFAAVLADLAETTWTADLRPIVERANTGLAMAQGAGA